MKKILVIVCAATTILSCNQQQKKTTTYQVNEATSKVEWKGSAKDHFHVGSFDVKGSLNASEDGSVNSGDFIIPIASIQDYDLQDPIRQALLNDLKSANFFNLAIHPEAKFHITNIKAYSTDDTVAVAGSNYLLSGDFTMLGETHPVSFPAKIISNQNGLSAEAKFNIDRTKWGMNIYSDSSKALYIYPDINIHLKLQATNEKLAKL